MVVSPYHRQHTRPRPVGYLAQLGVSAHRGFAGIVQAFALLVEHPHRSMLTSHECTSNLLVSTSRWEGGNHQCMSMCVCTVHPAMPMPQTCGGGYLCKVFSKLCASRLTVVAALLEWLSDRAKPPSCPHPVRVLPALLYQLAAAQLSAGPGKEPALPLQCTLRILAMPPRAFGTTGDGPTARKYRQRAARVRYGMGVCSQPNGSQVPTESCQRTAWHGGM